VKLHGEWWNELGSKMVIEVDPDDPKTFRGLYHTNVGNAQEKRYPLLGRCDNRHLDSRMVGFVVVWNADPPDGDAPAVNPSVTTWCGQLQIVKDQEVIATTWLLNRLTAPADDWESTLVGMDYFKRKKPSEATIEAAKKYGRASRALG
jgi:Avidin family